MKKYIDGFVLPVAKNKIHAYKKLAGKAGKIWLEYGALEYNEYILEDPRSSEMISFPQLAAAKKGETVVLAYIVYKSRTHHDKVNAKVLSDKRMEKLCPGDMPFNWKRMAYGGFESIVSL